MSPQCDMSAACKRPVTTIEDTGYVYCTPHGQLRKSYGARARLMRPWEIKLIEAGQMIPGYRPGRKPTSTNIETTAHVMAAVKGMSKEPIQLVITNGVKGITVSARHGLNPSTQVSFTPGQARELAVQLIARAVYIENYETKGASA